MTNTTNFVVVLDFSEAPRENRKSSRSYFIRAQGRGRSVLHRLSNLFTKRRKRKLTNVSSKLCFNSHMVTNNQRLRK